MFTRSWFTRYYFNSRYFNRGGDSEEYGLPEANSVASARANEWRATARQDIEIPPRANDYVVRPARSGRSIET